MKFLIQKINGEIRHDFAFVLVESIRFHNWLHNSDKIIHKFFNTKEDQKEFQFKEIHRKYVPVGSVEFVSAFIYQFYGLYVKPINVPEELFSLRFSGRRIFNGNHKDLKNLQGKYFVKSNDQIKYFTEVLNCDDENTPEIPVGNYQISEYLNGIESEWRVFVYNNKMVGLQNYVGDYTIFPDIIKIKEIINEYKCVATIAYTLDVGVRRKDGNEYTTFIIEIHPFFSCGLYGFSDHSIYPYMLYRWFQQYVKKIII